MPSPTIARVTKAALLAAIAGGAFSAAPHAHAADKWWNAANGNWGTAANWFSQGAPLNADNVFIGNTAIAENAFVDLNVNATIASLTMTDGMRVQTNTFKLTVTGHTLLSGENLAGNGITYSSMVQVMQGPAAVDFQTGSLTITDGADLWIEDGATVQVDGLLDLQANSSIYAEGLINLTKNAGTALRIDGTLQAATSVAGLTINQLGTGLIDLDGSVAEGANRGLNITGAMNDGSAFAHLTINGTALTDPFDDLLWIGGNNTVRMNLSSGWTLGSLGLLRLSSFHPDRIPTLEGSTLTVNGRIALESASRDAEIDCPLILQPTAQIELAQGSRLYCMDPITVQGGSGTLASDSRLNFSGPSQWNGNLSLDGTGTLFVHGNALVLGPSVINAHAAKLDGSGATVWNIQDSLTVNTQSIDPLNLPTPDVFNGTFNVSGPQSAKLTINLQNPGGIWTMFGVMNLAAPFGDATSRLAGSLVAIQGNLNVSGSVRCDAGYGLYPGSVTTFATQAASFENAASAIIFAGAQFLGGGSLVCAPTGGIRLDNGLNTGSARLVNHGNLEITFGVGQAVVAGFTQSNSGTYHVDIGGYAPATRHDHLVVANQPAALDGAVDIDLVDAGDGFFFPIVGDSFVILTSRNGLVGSFDSVAPTVRAGVVYHWSLVYDATTVRARLDSISVRCPADFNGDGFVDFFDYDDFVTCFEGGPCPPGRNPDMNFDGFVDFFDFDDFVQAFEQGC